MDYEVFYEMCDLGLNMSFWSNFHLYRGVEKEVYLGCFEKRLYRDYVSNAKYSISGISEHQIYF
jgi:hypothetical protein